MSGIFQMQWHVFSYSHVWIQLISETVKYLTTMSHTPFLNKQSLKGCKEIILPLLLIVN